MKKKIAILLAVAMLVAAAVPMNLFAASTNSISTNSYSAPGNTLFPDPRLAATTGPAGYNSAAGKYNGGGLAIGANYVVKGTDLIIQINDVPTADGAFRIELENARFAYMTDSTALGTPNVNVANSRSTFSTNWLTPGTTTYVPGADNSNSINGHNFANSTSYAGVRTYFNLQHVKVTAAALTEAIAEATGEKAVADLINEVATTLTGTNTAATTVAGVKAAMDAVVPKGPWADVASVTSLETASIGALIAGTTIYGAAGNAAIFSASTQGAAINTAATGAASVKAALLAYWNKQMAAYFSRAAAVKALVDAVPAGATADEIAANVATAQGYVNGFIAEISAAAATAAAKVANLTLEDTRFDNGDYDRDMSYGLAVSQYDPTSAVVYIRAADWTNNPSLVGTKGSIIRIPLALVTSVTEDNVRVKIVQTTTTVVSATTHNINVYGTGATTVVPGALAYGRERISLNTLTIREERIGTITGGRFYLQAPEGYEWATLSNAKIAIEAGLTGPTVATPLVVGTNIGYVNYPNDEDDFQREIWIQPNAGGITVSRSTVISGKLFLSGLVLVPKYDNTEFDDELKISVNGYSLGGADNRGAGGISDQTGILVATRKDWNLRVTAGTPAPVYSGFRNQPTANVVMEEVVQNSWWAERYIDLVLTDKDGTPLTTAKITGISFVPASGSMAEGHSTGAITTRLTPRATAEKGRFSGNIGSEATVTFDVANGNKVTLGSWKVASGYLGKVTMRFYVSVEAGWEGDIYVKAQGGSGVYAESATPVQIATSTNAVTIQAATKDVQIGYQRYAVSDVVITETEAGRLYKDDVNTLSMSEFTNAYSLMNNIRFVPITQANNVVYTGDRFTATFAPNTNNAIQFTVTRTSTSPATITLKNLELNIDHTVPYGKYDLILTGGSICDNSVDLWNATGAMTVATGSAIGTENKADYDKFAKRGMVVENYVSVMTPGANVGANNNVKVVEGAQTAVVNGEVVDFEYPCYISGYSFMVPVRFLVKALGLDDTKDLHWDPIAHTVTIINDRRTIVFTENSSVMILNTAPINMTDSLGNVVKAELTNGRMYVPFRKLAEALGVRIIWHEDTATAEFNPVSSNY